MPTVHAAVLQFAASDLGPFWREIKELGLLSDANVAAANTVELLRSTLATNIGAATVHAAVKQVATNYSRVVDASRDNGIISDAIMNPLTTVDAFIALFGNTNTANKGTFLQ